MDEQTEPDFQLDALAKLDVDDQREVVAWWIAQYGRASTEAAHLLEAKQRDMARIKAWHTAALRPVMRRAEYRRDRIEWYVRGRLRVEADGREVTDPKVWERLTKRFKFPTGYVQAVRVGPSFEVVDDVGWNEWNLSTRIEAAKDVDALAGLLALFGGSVAVSFAAPKADDPMFAVTSAGVVFTGTGEIVTSLRFVAAHVRVNAPNTGGEELPAWQPPPAFWNEPDEQMAETD